MMTTRREFFRSHFLAIPRSFAGELLFYLPICEEGQREGLWESNGQEEQVVVEQFLDHLADRPVRFSAGQANHRTHLAKVSLRQFVARRILLKTFVLPTSYVNFQGHSSLLSNVSCGEVSNTVQFFDIMWRHFVSINASSASLHSRLEDEVNRGIVSAKYPNVTFMASHSTSTHIWSSSDNLMINFSCNFHYPQLGRPRFFMGQTLFQGHDATRRRYG